MSEGHSTYTPKTGLGRWFDARMPLPRLVYDSFVAYPVPRNLNYFWAFGGILSVMLVVQILSGIVLAMHYVSDTSLAFDSVEKIVRDVNGGWMLRYLHANGASFFFIAVYIHIFRGLYYGSYKAPRELLWILGCIIYLLMMATGFMGYVLPWGQMSFWGATVITGFFSAIPLVGNWIQELLLGGFAVDNPTLNRFFALHYLLPFMIAGVVVLHIWALHVVGQNNPTGIEVKSKTDTVAFTPYATIKDGMAMVVFALVFAFAYGRVGRLGVRATSVLLALAAFVAVVLVPQIKYPANPPAVGSPETIGIRTGLFFIMLVLSLAAMAAVVMLARRLWASHGGWNATLIAGAASSFSSRSSSSPCRRSTRCPRTSRQTCCGASA